MFNKYWRIYMTDKTNNVDLALARMDRTDRSKLKSEIYDRALQKMNPVEQDEIEKMNAKLVAGLRGFGEESAKEFLVTLAIAVEKRMRQVEARKGRSTN